MSASEIEVPGSSLGMKVFRLPDDIPSPRDLIDLLMAECSFKPDIERAGFHDLDEDGSVLRGNFSVVVAFEVEHLADGLMTKSLFKRIESCEWMVFPGYFLVWGKTDPAKGAVLGLANTVGRGVTPAEWTASQLSDLQGRMTQVKAVSIIQAKDQPIRRARFAGNLEEDAYSELVDPRGVESVSGIVETPLGPLSLTVARKGAIRWGVKKGFILTVDCIRWLLGLLAGASAVTADERIAKRIQKWDQDMKKAGCRVEVGTGDGPPAVIGVGSKIGGGS